MKAKTKDATTSYIIRDIDARLWAQFKARAKTDGRSLKWLLEHMIKLYTERGLD